MIQLVFCSLATSCLLFSHTGHADSFSVSRNQPVTEVSHNVKLFLKDGVVTYKVQRTFVNNGKRSEQVVLQINLPYGAAATGLRIRAVDTWYDGELMEREEARKIYQELTGIGIAIPKDPALLEWMWADRLRLFMFPVMAGRSSTVEYTLTVPTRYAGGRYSVTYPLNMDHTKLVDPVLTVMNDAKEVSVQVNKKIIAAGQPFILTEDMIPRCKVGELVESGTCAVSIIDVSEARPSPVDKVKFSLDVRHTYKGDLRVELVSPAGDIYGVVNHEGGSGNHIQLTKDIEVKPTDGRGTWRLVIRDETGLDVGSLERWSLEFVNGNSARTYDSLDTPLFVPDVAGEDNGNQATIALNLTKPRRVDARLGRVVASKHKQFSRLDVEVAKPFSEIPNAPHVVFLVDASFSMGNVGIENQLAIVKAFISYVPDGIVEIIMYRRHADLLFNDFIEASQFDGELAKVRKTEKLVPHNGSAVDEAFGRAVRLLARKKGPAYIVGFTDELLRPAFQNKKTISVLRRTAPGVVVHLVTPERGSYAVLYREDDNPLAPIPRTRGGIYARFNYARTGDGYSEKEMNTTALGLVRPVGIDHFRVTGAEFETVAESTGYSDTLKEGAGIRLFEKMEKSPTQATLRGEIWSRPFTRKVLVTSPFSQATAGFVFSQDMDDDLTNEEMLKVAFYGRAVSPVTSYLAIEPGVRPSTDGLGELGLSGVGRGDGGNGAGGLGMSRGGTIRPNLKNDIQSVIDSCSTKYSTEQQVHLRNQHVIVHTTYLEIVDVIATHPENSYQHCVVEGIWQVKLRVDAYTKQRDVYKISI